MTHTQIAGPLRARINKLAHAQGLTHEARQKAAMLAQVQTARDVGARYDELAELVAAMEAEALGSGGG